MSSGWGREGNFSLRPYSTLRSIRSACSLMATPPSAQRLARWVSGLLSWCSHHISRTDSGSGTSACSGNGDGRFALRRLRIRGARQSRFCRPGTATRYCWLQYVQRLPYVQKCPGRLGSYVRNRIGGDPVPSYHAVSQLVAIVVVTAPTML